ncbi:MAG: hypothetical protein IPM57_11390 [Oligoflexia bacterium]|nr:hypothetical protein [Oligoflexia bacterium]
MLLSLLLLFSLKAQAQVDATYAHEKDAAVLLGQKIQEQFGINSGYAITEVRGVTLMSPRFEFSGKIRILARIGNLFTTSLATIGTNPSEVVSVTGFDRPSIRARQLIYGDFKHGRWYILDLGLALFNISGYAPEPFRYWSARVGLHEALHTPFISPRFEIGLTLRSRSDTVQATGLAFIYPPTFDVSVGFHKEIKEKFYTAFNLKFDQALTNQKVAGIYDRSSIRAFEAPTLLVGFAELGWHIDYINSVFFRFSDHVFSWPNDVNSMLWNYFEEGYLGRSYSLYWRWQW